MAPTPWVSKPQLLLDLMPHAVKIRNIPVYMPKSLRRPFRRVSLLRRMPSLKVLAGTPRGGVHIRFRPSATQIHNILPTSSPPHASNEHISREWRMLGVVEQGARQTVDTGIVSVVVGTTQELFSPQPHERIHVNSMLQVAAL